MAACPAKLLLYKHDLTQAKKKNTTIVIKKEREREGMGNGTPNRSS